MGLVRRRQVTAKALPFIAAAIAATVGLAAATALPLISSAIAPPATFMVTGPSVHDTGSGGGIRQGLSASLP